MLEWPDISLPPINLYAVPKMNPNACSTCAHIMQPQGGWCYMFRDEPTGVCAKHTLNAPESKSWIIGDIHMPSMPIAFRDLIPGPDAAMKLVNLGLDCYQGVQDVTVRAVQTAGETVSDTASSVGDIASSGLTAAGEAASVGIDAVVAVGGGIVDVASGAVEVVGSVAEVAGSIAGGIADSL